MRRKLMAVLAGLLFITALSAQTKKYPSVFWEITGNGLKKPSYLFGTMHVSSKLAFHLSDSFYTAMQSVDVVALEQNPSLWQHDMMLLDDAQKNISAYMSNGANDYLNETSFQPEKYEDNLKEALTDQPTVINGLLYRTYQSQQDYEENTYLDLYIYQTGRKLGKLGAGVEDYKQTQRLTFEAYQDATKEKNKKRPDTDGESIYDIEKKIQGAYRRGDLDMLDSLEKYEFTSPAFIEKFLYKRNEIQANSIDTILRHNSLFVGVGAAHLPGKRGVIELLRKKGYTLRPLYMQVRDADKKTGVDKMRVPVTFNAVQTTDGFIRMQLPGPLYKRNDSRQNINDGWQYADMDNGTYYMLTRVKTQAALRGETNKSVLQKIDSLLYENIPGKIISKTTITKNGYPGFDIVNRTRRGDMQRYNIIVTPFEVLVFKMSGNDDYVSGSEADTFFNSIIVYHPGQQQNNFTSNSAGFSIAFPQQPYISINKTGSDGLPRFEFEATDTTNGNTYVVWKKTVNNYRFLEEDTFDLSLMEESIKRSEAVDKETSRSFDVQNGYHALNMQFALKNGNTLWAKAVLRGAHYYLIAVSSKDKHFHSEPFLNSFTLTSFGYQQPALYTDTALRFTVQTPVKPILDTFLLRMVHETQNNTLRQTSNNVTYWNKDKIAWFQNDSTGEAVLVNCIKYPKYFYSKDSARFWNKEMYLKQYDGMVIQQKQPVKINDSCSGYKIILRDTNTVRQINIYYLLQQDCLFQLTALSDTVSNESAFVRTFFSSFQPDKRTQGASVFTDKLSRFFADYHSKDSAIQKFAAEAVPNVYFTCKGLPEVKKILAAQQYSDKNYFEAKSRFIRELGYIDDSTCVQNVEKLLADIYKQTADTGYFQNEVLLALARLKTKSAYDTLKTLLLTDLPVFDESEEYEDLFNLLQDSLSLAKNLYPDVLQLASLEDYKEPVVSLLRMLKDSNYISAGNYATYYSRIYFDAKTELKKQQNKDEKLLEKQNDDNDNNDVHYSAYKQRYNGELNSILHDYSILLVPFYDTIPAVKKYFDKLLQSKDPATQMQTAVVLAQNNKMVPDTIWKNIAAKDKYRAVLLHQLKKAHKESLFPQNEKSQESLAKAVLLNDKDADQFQSLQMVGRQLVSTKKGTGYVYFFKYKMNKDDDWKMGISGIQPLTVKEVSDNGDVTIMTDKRLLDSEPVAEQFADQLKKLLYTLHESAYHFFSDNTYNYLLRDYNDGN